MILRERIAEFIKARTPVFYLGTDELRRAQEEISSVAAEIGAEVRVFSSGTNTLTVGKKREPADPLSVLDSIQKRGTEGLFRGNQVVWVLRYFHLFLHPPDPLILGRLREIIEFSRFTDTVVIVGGADFNLPDELADIPVLRSRCPDRQELSEIFDFGLPPEEKEKAVRACSGMSPGR